MASDAWAVTAPPTAQARAPRGDSLAGIGALQRPHIGAATAATFAREGAKVIVADINLAGAQAQVDSIRAAGPQDLVILAVKANQVEPVIDDLPALFHDETVLIPMQNGIPWWYDIGLAAGQPEACGLRTELRKPLLPLLGRGWGVQAARFRLRRTTCLRQARGNTSR